MDRDSARLEPIIEPAVQALRKVFMGGNHEDADVTAARLASSVLATWARLKQAERAQEGIYFAMARELAEDREQLARYIRLTLPDVPIVRVMDAKKLPEPKKK